jgi:hypothetical protein
MKEGSVVSLRWVVRGVGCALVLLALSAPAAQAGLISGVLPGLVSPSDTPSTCDTTSSQAFKSVDGDRSNYVLVPGGSFEAGATGWTLGRGATVVSGNEPWKVNGAKDNRSLYIPSGSFATTPPMCFAPGDWHMRFFAASSSSRYSSLQVRVRVKSLLGVLSVLDGGKIAANTAWQPSPRLALLLTNVTGLLSTDSVSFQFVPSDSASWRIDDVYLDPWRDG